MGAAVATCAPMAELADGVISILDDTHLAPDTATSAVEEFLFEPSFSPHVIDHLSLQLLAKRSPQEQALEGQELASAPLATVEEFLFEPSFSPHVIDHLSLQLLAKRSPQEQALEDQEFASAPLATV